MTQEERKRSEAQRKRIFEMSRAANFVSSGGSAPVYHPLRSNRVITPRDRADELVDRLGFTPADDGPIDWRALTASG